MPRLIHSSITGRLDAESVILGHDDGVCRLSSVLLSRFPKTGGEGGPGCGETREGATFSITGSGSVRLLDFGLTLIGPRAARGVP